MIKKLRIFLIVPLVIVLMVFASSVFSTPPSLTIMSYNIHLGKGTDGVLDLDRIAQVINSVNPDIVALQEVDKNTNRSGNVDQAAVLGNLTGMNAEFGGALFDDGGEYGNAILTKHPYTVIGNYPLPGSSDPRAALFLDVDLSALYGTSTHITFVGTHLDHKSDSVRIQSVKNIETYIRNLPARPALIGGDMNATPGSATMNEFALNWSIANLGQPLYTFPAGTPDRQLDYVMYRRGVDWSFNAIQVLNQPVASDHRPIYYSYELDLSAPLPPPPSSGIALTTSGFRSKNQIKVNLAWTGADSANVDIYRGGVLIIITPDDGLHTDTINQRRGTFVYKVCEAGTSICSNESSVTI